MQLMYAVIFLSLGEMACTPSGGQSEPFFGTSPALIKDIMAEEKEKVVSNARFSGNNCPWFVEPRQRTASFDVGIHAHHTLLRSDGSLVADMSPH